MMAGIRVSDDGWNSVMMARIRLSDDDWNSVMMAGIRAPFQVLVF